MFDNATGVGRCGADGTVALTRLFSLFCAHHGFETRFCNPYSGHEKGGVENAVGFVRRNLMVPEPSAEGWDALTRSWLDACDAVAEREHYREAVPIRGLFETDQDHMLPLLGTPFDACGWRSVKTDRTGTVLIDGDWYLAGPKWHSMRIRAGGLGRRAAEHGRRTHCDAGTRVAGGGSRALSWSRRRCWRSSRISPACGAKARFAAIPRQRARSARPDGRPGAPTCPTTSESRPRPAASRPPPGPSP